MSFSKTRTYKDPFNKGRKLPSVTTILNLLDKPALMYWSVNCCCDYLSKIFVEKESISSVQLFGAIEKAKKEWRNVQGEALDIGTEVHSAIQTYLGSGKEPKIENQAVLNAFVAFLEWKDKHKLQVIAVETVVYGKDYAGTADLICMLDNVPTLLDFKSSKAIYDEYFYQVSAYAKAYNLFVSPGITQVGVLRLDKESGMPEIALKNEEKIEKYYMAFSKLVEFWWEKQKIKEN